MNNSINILPYGWQIHTLVDEDGHLNLYIKNTESQEIWPVDTGQGSGINEQYALRFTTPEIEDDYATNTISER